MVNNMRRIFQFKYDRQDITQDELREYQTGLSEMLGDSGDVVLMLPNDISFTELSLEELLVLRDTINSVIDSRLS